MDIEKLFNTVEEFETFVENTKCHNCGRTIENNFIKIAFSRTEDKAVFVCFDCFGKANEDIRKQNIKRLIDKIEVEADLEISKAHKYRLKKIYNQFNFSIVDEAIDRGLAQYYQYGNYDSLNEMMYKLGGICYNISQEQCIDESDTDETE